MENTVVLCLKIHTNSFRCFLNHLYDDPTKHLGKGPRKASQKKQKKGSVTAMPSVSGLLTMGGLPSTSLSVVAPVVVQPPPVDLPQQVPPPQVPPQQVPPLLVPPLLVPPLLVTSLLVPPLETPPTSQGLVSSASNCSKSVQLYIQQLHGDIAKRDKKVKQTNYFIDQQLKNSKFIYIYIISRLKNSRRN